MKKMILLRILAVMLIFSMGIIIVVSSCASSPATTNVPAEMRLDDPRMPYDTFDEKGFLRGYWLGTRAPELLSNQVSVITPYRLLSLSFGNEGRITYPQHLKNNQISKDGYWLYVFTKPEETVFSFHFYKSARVNTGISANSYETVNINMPNQSQKHVLRPGLEYFFDSKIEDVTKTITRMVGRAGEYSVTVQLMQRNARNFEERRALASARNRKYLEPFDPTVPFSNTSWLEVTDGYIITEFNGESVNWGYKNEKISTTIGVPSGQAVIKFTGDGKTFRIIDTKLIAGSRYVIYINNGCQVNNLTTSQNVSWKWLSQYGK